MAAIDPRDPLAQEGEYKDVIELIAEEARSFLLTLDERSVRPTNADRAVAAFDVPLPESGEGAVAALRELIDTGMDSVISSAGPRFFHFVIGGATPAALGADWLTSVIDQNAGSWVASPLATHLETVALDWLKQLFRLPGQWGGVLTTGATMANYTGLMAARQWWGNHHGVDIAQEGMAGLPQIPVLSSGYLHISAVKALAMLGVGRRHIRKAAADDIGRVDLTGLEEELQALSGAPAIVIANAGEVNAGDFDPIGAMAKLSDRYGAWLHVDGAFGLFSRLTPRTQDLTAGIEAADSVIADGHKWLNVPYDCGFAFVRDQALLLESFTAVADYLPDADYPRPIWSYMGPEMSRRARALTVWSTLRAYGREGYRLMVERNLDLAQLLAELVDRAPNLERLAPVLLNIVCFRAHPPGASEEELNHLNDRLGDAILDDGRVYVGTTVFGGKVALRPAIVNWRCTHRDVEVLADVVAELADEVWASRGDG